MKKYCEATEELKRLYRSIGRRDEEDKEHGFSQDVDSRYGHCPKCSFTYNCKSCPNCGYNEDYWECPDN